MSTEGREGDEARRRSLAQLRSQLGQPGMVSVSDEVRPPADGEDEESGSGDDDRPLKDLPRVGMLLVLRPVVSRDCLCPLSGLGRLPRGDGVGAPASPAARGWLSRVKQAVRAHERHTLSAACRGAARAELCSCPGELFRAVGSLECRVKTGAGAF